MPHTTRESWLVALVEALRPLFAAYGACLPPKIRVACGWPTGSRRSATGRVVLGECWMPEASADGTFEIFVTPKLADPFAVAEIIAHEIVHACLGPGCRGHGPAFRKLATRIGLTGRMKSTHAGDRLRAELITIVQTLGPYGHAALDDAIEQRKKQTTRMLAVMCEHCGYRVRVAATWLSERGYPFCPDAVRMILDSK